MGTFEFGGVVFEDIRLPCNTEAMTTLVEALESGAIPQGNGYLRTSGGYCCLGAACKVLLPEGRWELSHDYGEYSSAYNFIFGGMPGYGYYMPKVAAERLGVNLVQAEPSESQGYDIQVSGPSVGDAASARRRLGMHNGFLTASVMNDRRAPFPVIAARLRAVYL